MFKKILALAFRWQLLRFPSIHDKTKYFGGVFSSISQQTRMNVLLPNMVHSPFWFGAWRSLGTISQRQPVFLNIHSAYRRFSTALQQSAASAGLAFKGQGLKKEKQEPSKRLKRFIENRKREQEWGRKYFPAFPDLIFYLKFMAVTSSGVIIGWIFYPNYAEYKLAEDDPTFVVDSATGVKPEKNAMIKMYTLLPLRLLSRAWGRINNGSDVPVFIRPYFFGLFSKVYNVNIDEAINPDLKSYENFSEFFRRPIKSSVRPVDGSVELVSPSDGKILHFGEIVNGSVEQVKGITYSLQKFLGPLNSDPVHDEWGREPGYEYNWSHAPLPQYTKALMHHPEKNVLYHCVIYLAPGDYHRFHSPADWIVKHRRHFPGDLLSVNPKIASLVPNLFVLNERVVLSGEWEHGFFSMAAVGATNVGSVSIYGDVTLDTNRPKRMHGGYYDKEYNDVPVKKGVGMGEFNLGSTIVLVFEAPKSFKYCIQANDKIQYGRALQQL